ncbi:hypothetical protein HO173_006797 [Letharia columbiana]|uniref:Uncharacterized protein n=1 Tax=Letharia columbiana TaxID=112416 RepID=A0A8H6FUZ1_9LECA|nr:uncharacterized protein HO173_006797 [Letharia columbiana]KAF6235168.1 hypothetical protein HO173_006797 [Letharia columbiana]
MRQHTTSYLALPLFINIFHIQVPTCFSLTPTTNTIPWTSKAMHHIPIASLSVLALISPVLVSSNAPPQAPPPQQRTTLRPINILDYEASVGLQRRDSTDLSVLVPQNHSELVYGSPADDGRFLLANMTLHAPDGLPIVLLERFEELDVEVDCRDDEGVLSLMFGSSDAFEYAREKWGYVNKVDDGKFLLIANKDGCGPGGQRQPYVISNITDDTATLNLSLAAQAVPWSDVGGSYELDFGHAIPIRQPQQLQGRSWWDNAKNAGNDALNATEGNLDETKNASLLLSAGQQNKRTTIYTDPGADLTIDCTNCFMIGSLEVMGHLSVLDFNLRDLILIASPKSVLATLEFEASITADYESTPLNFTKELPSIPIPELGFSIPEIMTIGPSLTYTVGASGSFSGSATVDFGLQATVPDSAQIVADYSNSGASTATNFSGGQLTPKFDIKNGSASVTLSAFSQLGINFGVDLFKLGAVTVTVTVKLPEISTTLTANYDKLGACSQGVGASKTGIEIDSRVSIEVDLDMDAKLLDKGPSWSKTLFSDSKHLYSHCYPLNIPELLPEQNVTRVPTLPSAPSVSAFSSGVPAPASPTWELERRWAILPPGDRWALRSAWVPSLPTGIPSKSGLQTNSSSSSGRPGSGSSSNNGMTSTTSTTEPTSTLTTSLTNSISESLPITPSTTSTVNPTSTLATSLTTSSSEPSSLLPSTTPKTGPVSTLATSVTSSSTKSSSIAHSTFSTGESMSTSSSTDSSMLPSTTSTIKPTLTPGTSSTSSKVGLSSILSPSTPESSTMTSTLTTSSTSSEIESSSTFISSTSSSTSLNSLTTSSSSIVPSVTPSLSAQKPSHSTEADAAGNSPGVTPTTLTPSKSASKEHLKVPVPASTSASSSLLPDPGAKTAVNQPKVTHTPAEPSPKISAILPAPKPDATLSPKLAKGADKSSSNSQGHPKKHHHSR